LSSERSVSPTVIVIGLALLVHSHRRAAQRKVKLLSLPEVPTVYPFMPENRRIAADIAKLPEPTSLVKRSALIHINALSPVVQGNNDTEDEVLTGRSLGGVWCRDISSQYADGTGSGMILMVRTCRMLRRHFLMPSAKSGSCEKRAGTTIRP
jgi:hypothetical protein